MKESFAAANTNLNALAHLHDILPSEIKNMHDAITERFYLDSVRKRYKTEHNESKVIVRTGTETEFILYHKESKTYNAVDLKDIIKNKRESNYAQNTPEHALNNFLTELKNNAKDLIFRANEDKHKLYDHEKIEIVTYPYIPEESFSKQIELRDIAQKLAQKHGFEIIPYTSHHHISLSEIDNQDNRSMLTRRRWVNDNDRTDNPLYSPLPEHMARSIATIQKLAPALFISPDRIENLLCLASGRRRPITTVHSILAIEPSEVSTYGSTRNPSSVRIRKWFDASTVENRLAPLDPFTSHYLNLCAINWGIEKFNDPLYKAEEIFIKIPENPETPAPDPFEKDFKKLIQTTIDNFDILSQAIPADILGLLINERMDAYLEFAAAPPYQNKDGAYSKSEHYGKDSFYDAIELETLRGQLHMMRQDVDLKIAATKNNAQQAFKAWEYSLTA